MLSDHLFRNQNLSVNIGLKTSAGRNVESISSSNCKTEHTSSWNLTVNEIFHLIAKWYIRSGGIKWGYRAEGAAGQLAPSTVYEQLCSNRERRKGERNTPRGRDGV